MLSKLLPYLRPYRGQIAWALAQVFLITGFELLKPWPLQVVIDDVLGGKPFPVEALHAVPASRLLLFACLGIVVVHLGSGGLTLLHNYTTIRVGQNMVNNLRGALYAHLQRLSLAFHDRQRVGDLHLPNHRRQFCRPDNDHERGIADPVGDGSARRDAVHSVSARSDPDPARVVRRPGVVRADRGVQPQDRRCRHRGAHRESRVYSLVQWAMSSIKVVQAFTKEEDEHRRFMGASRESLRATLRLYNWQTLYSGAVNAVIAGGTALVIYAGARAVISGALTVGQLIVFISYLAQLYAPINQITQSWGLIAGARVGARRVFEVLDTEPDLADGTRSFPLEGARGGIAWRGVGFRYRPQTPVLKDIDLVVPAGAKIAIVGATGAGKSTMLGLLPRFYDPTAGAVEIDGVDLREYTLKSLRSQIALVLQPPLIFPLSVRDNIAYGRPGADDAAIERAARLACIDDLIGSLPDGYDTVIGESGMSLSEGEKQRVTIARALLRDAPILILDEPTSALDVATEALVMAGIERLMEGRTTFIIAHRLSTVRRCDRIVVVQEGVIAEQGGLAELLRRDGVFAGYYRSQFAPEHADTTEIAAVI